MRWFASRNLPHVMLVTAFVGILGEPAYSYDLPAAAVD